MEKKRAETILYEQAIRHTESNRRSSKRMYTGSTRVCVYVCVCNVRTINEIKIGSDEREKKRDENKSKIYMLLNILRMLLYAHLTHRIPSHKHNHNMGYERMRESINTIHTCNTQAHTERPSRNE